MLTKTATKTVSSGRASPRTSTRQQFHWAAASRVLRGLLIALCCVSGIAADTIAADVSNTAITKDVARAVVAAPRIDAVLSPLLARLALMPEVARAKFATHQAIDDPVREAKVMDASASAAARLGLEPDAMRKLSRALIEAAKVIQRKRIATWTATALPDGPVPDLAATIRPAIDRADTALLRALALELRDLQRNTARLDTIVSAIEAADVDHGHALDISAALSGLQYRPLAAHESNMDLMAARGVLRVGMPGDYAPFAYNASDKPPLIKHQPRTDADKTVATLVGIDVELAHDLAASLGVHLQIVATSWRDLSADLAANRFDIGMGGVTRTLQRAKTALFSDAYLEDGKGALARCAIARELTDLAHIDRPGVRVIVNPGGTNEQFVREHIAHAAVRVHSDNISIFTALATGEADVMLTDLIEARWQARSDPRLCVALSGARLSTIQKALLLPRDLPLQQYVNLWLVGLQESGRLRAIVSRYVPDDPPFPAHKVPVRP